MLAWSKTKLVLTLNFFSKDECHHFLGIFILLQKFWISCCANAAFPWLVSTTKTALSVLHYQAPCVVWAQWVGTWILSYICTSLSDLPNCHSGVILATTYSCLICLHFLNSLCGNSQGVTKKKVESKYFWGNVEDWQPIARVYCLKKDLEALDNKDLIGCGRGKNPLNMFAVGGEIPGKLSISAQK